MIYIRRYFTGVRTIYTFEKSSQNEHPDVSRLLILQPPKGHSRQHPLFLELGSNRIGMLKLLALWFRLQFHIYPLEHGLLNHIEKIYPDIDWAV